MHEGEMKIEIFKPFEEAYELMKTILFRPFDLKKWCVIGFAAFLAHIGSGGFHLNFGNFNSHQTVEEREALQTVIDWFNQIPLWILVSGAIAIATIIVALMVVCAWLRGRGRFIFIDNVVKNRGAIVEPWHEFRKEGNSFFLFGLLAFLGSMILGMIVALPFVVPLLRGGKLSDFATPTYIVLFVVWIAVWILIMVAWAVTTHIMVVVMYCRRCLAVEALSIALTLISRFPGAITLYLLFWILIAIGAGMVSCAAICATCCLAMIPYVGAVILLPVSVCMRAFGLFFLRQFGPDYDAFARATPAIFPEPPPLPS